MSLFGNSDVVMLQKRVTELESSLDDSDARLVEVEAENESYKKSIESFHLSTSKYDKQMETMKLQHEAKIKELETKLAETEKSVNRKVNQMLQSVGVNNFLIEIPTQIKSPRDVYEQYLKMPVGSAKTEFFKNNEQAIRKGMDV